ncbi:translocase [Salipiger sp. 1_MG-2023]|uniref:translocase n=1 Tax=Salipiger sp. 1_MG-2023 TaxID=3062665 RepID=UPI0026E285CD|nr:translocase [Salipiger sp. 1_MG-2023]MDO6585691.1 translocase [Salipiger sp. 1_MG-2023]
MAHLKTVLLGVATVGVALSIGHVMQYGTVKAAPEISTADIDARSIVDTSSAMRRHLSTQAANLERLPESVTLAAIREEVISSLPLAAKAEIVDCAVSLSAAPRAGAVVALSLTAPCYGSERVTFDHRGLTFTEITAPDGTLQVNVPALSEDALFVATFDGGATASVRTDVPALPFYDRVVLQWTGDSGLSLHAREFGATYFSEGHISAARDGEMSRTARGEGGFLNLLGNSAAPGAQVAEIYSFPVGTVRREGTVELTIEAEVTPANCGREIAAQTLEYHNLLPLKRRELRLDMPGCDDASGFLVLKNAVEDLKIAAR